MKNNQQLFQSALNVIPGGVNSPVRAFGAVGGIPPFIIRAKGAKLWDEEEREYIDYVGSWGTAIVGHAHSEVVDAVQFSARNGLSFGAPTKAEIELAETICHLMPSIVKVRLTSSGTEATMSAIRLARGFTKRNHIVKFEGCYHGHSDSLLVKAGSGLLTFGQPNSAGIPEDFAKYTLVLKYNDVEMLEQVFQEKGETIAGVIVEPFAGNMNFVKPTESFINALNRLTKQYNALLIYDEVMTAFRVGLHGAQGLHNIKPDLTTLGKVIGGGMPLAAFGGRSDVMDHISPLGPVYQAGTLSGNPLAVAAGLKTLEIVQRVGFYENIAQNTKKLVKGINHIASEFNVDLCADFIGGMFGIYCRKTIPTNFQQIEECDSVFFKQFFHLMLEKGIYLAPSAYEAGFISTAHDEALIEQTLQTLRTVLKTM